jgi:hypothetical protein
MRPEDLSELLRAQPFVPFRIHMTDGKFYDIFHPEAVMLFRTRAIIGLRPDPKNIYYNQTEQIALLHVVRTSPIPAVESEQTSTPAS